MTDWKEALKVGDTVSIPAGLGGYMLVKVTTVTATLI